MSTPILPSWKLEFDHEGTPDDSYSLVLDNGEPIPFVPIPNPVEGHPHQKKIEFPSMTLTEHVIAVRVCSLAGCVVSDGFAFHIAVIPQTPTNLHAAQ